MKLKKQVKIVFLVVFLLVFAFSIYKIITYYVELNKSNELNDNIIKDVIEVIPPSDVENNESESTEEVFKVDFDKLNSINSDTVGWIKFNNDKVNNPVVHTTNNDYYLHHTFDKAANNNGAIFMDYRNVSFDDQNVVLFGHSNNSMFGSLLDVFQDGFFDTEDNNYIYIYTPSATYVYQIFSYYVVEAEEYYITTSFATSSDFYTFIDTITRRRFKNFDIDVTTNDKILTLSTCSGYSGTNKRKVIHAKRITTSIE